MLLLENGNYLMMSYDPQIVDMSQIVPGGNEAATVIGLVIQEVDLDQTVYFQWRSWDHFEITDATADIDLTTDQIDYVHGNAFEIDDDGNILLSSRNMDEITKIDFATGNIIWRFGKNAENNMFTIVDDPTGFSHQHDIRRTASGTYSIYDNGNLHSPAFSQALEYAINETTMQAQLVWDYQRASVYAFATGSFRVYENGQRLIGWGTHYPLNITEINPDNNLAYDISLPDQVTSYRALKFDWKTNMFSARDEISFGNYAGHSGPKETYLYVFNNSNQEINITSTHNHLGDFIVSDIFPLSIDPGNSEIVIVAFEPTEEGDYSDVLTLNYDNDNMGRRIAIQVNVHGIWDEEIPTVFFDPVHGSINVQPNSTIAVSFDEPVRKVFGTEIQHSDIPNIVTLHKEDYNGAVVNFTGTINDEKTVITIVPEYQLLEEQQYYVELKAYRVEDYDANIVTHAEISYFKTGLLISVDEMTGTKSSCHPNPFSDELTLAFADATFRNIKILDITGRAVFEYTSDGASTTIHAEPLKQGIYLIKIFTPATGDIEVFKIVKR